MLLKRLFTSVAPLILLFHLTTAVAQDIPPADSQTVTNAEFVPVDLSKRETISGKSHTIAAYAIVLSVLFLYSVSLLRREKAVQKDLGQLNKNLKK